MAIADEINVRCSVSTEAATWFLFHPEDLAHRCDDPIDWWAEDFAIQKEFAAGRLIAVCTKKDGNTTIRLTNQGLTERERAYAHQSAEFRLLLQHERLYLGGGDVLPSAEQLSIEECDPSGYGWITVANGHYRATVYAIAWFEEPGAMDDNGYSTAQALTAYVVDLQSVTDLSETHTPGSIPVLSSAIYDENLWVDENGIEPLALEYPLLGWHEVIFPGIHQELDANAAKEPFELMDWQIIISPTIEEESIGTLFRASSLPGHWLDSGTTNLPENIQEIIKGEGTQLVRLKRVFEKNGIRWVEVEPYEPPASVVSQEAIAYLKQLQDLRKTAMGRV